MDDQEIEFSRRLDPDFLEMMAVFIGALVDQGINYSVRRIKSRPFKDTPCWIVTVIPNE